MKKKSYLSVDLDDVTVDTHGGLAVWHNKNYGTNYSKEDVNSFFLEELWGCSRPEVVRRLDQFFFSEAHYQLDPVDGAVRGIKELSKKYHLFLNSSRPEHAMRPTQELTRRHFSNVFKLILLSGHHHPDHPQRATKGEICLDFEAVAHLEDSLEHAGEVNEKVRMFCCLIKIGIKERSLKIQYEFIIGTTYSKGFCKV